eukprot:CAMPEP_0115666994 /NCGR_PEP_ID=MMETSP0272-20121206/49704_1 /TAXON_ID=71861 /ORGANISM="Scrippsiella trochoidea, Strain CCMP3099" /LENGTH=106 /DNA_ID=CAMNT_0003105513 /DNA_START=120 /DNA_END=439 /DNA_ORIENTATION=+
MFMFHRLLSLLTMMYNEQDELTVCDFVRTKDRKRIAEARRRRQEDPDGTGGGAPPQVRDHMTRTGNLDEAPWLRILTAASEGMRLVPVALPGDHAGMILMLSTQRT